jgi:hypothetical protein
LRMTALAWMKRAKSLEGGKELDTMNSQELKEVIHSLEVFMLIIYRMNVMSCISIYILSLYSLDCEVYYN